MKFVRIESGTLGKVLTPGDTATLTFAWPIEKVAYEVHVGPDGYEGYFTHCGRQFRKSGGGYADLDFFDYYDRLDPDRSALLRAWWKFITIEVVL